jgi:hypothetical protein
MRPERFSRKEAEKMQGVIVRTMRPLYDVGVGEMGIVCGMYLDYHGYVLSIRFSTPDLPQKSATYTLDWWDFLEAVYECVKVAWAMPFANSEERNAYYRAYKQRRRAEAIALLGGVCVRCGTTEDLEIDHIDRATKEYEIHDVLWSRREVRLAELAKCQLLCSYHHLFKTRVLDTMPEIPF